MLKSKTCRQEDLKKIKMMYKKMENDLDEEGDSLNAHAYFKAIERISKNLSVFKQTSFSTASNKYDPSPLIN